MDLLWHLNQNVGAIDCIYHFDTNLIWKKTIRLKNPQTTAIYMTMFSHPTFKHEDLAKCPDFLSDL